MPEKTPEQIYAETPVVIKNLAQKVLKIEREYITQAQSQGITEDLIVIFKGDLVNETN